jgi:hypothetical protein
MYFILTRHGYKNVREKPWNKASTVVYLKNSVNDSVQVYLVRWKPDRHGELQYLTDSIPEHGWVVAMV